MAVLLEWEHCCVTHEHGLPLFPGRIRVFSWERELLTDLFTWVTNQVSAWRGLWKRKTVDFTYMYSNGLYLHICILMVCMWLDKSFLPSRLLRSHRCQAWCTFSPPVTSESPSKLFTESATQSVPQVGSQWQLPLRRLQTGKTSAIK